VPANIYRRIALSCHRCLADVLCLAALCVGSRGTRRSEGRSDGSGMKSDQANGGDVRPSTLIYLQSLRASRRGCQLALWTG